MVKILIPLVFIFSINCFAEDGGLNETKEKIAWKWPSFLSRLQASTILESQQPQSSQPAPQEVQKEKLEVLKTSKSSLKIEYNVATDTNFVLINIARVELPEEKEIVVVPIKYGQVRTKIFFRKGAGRYRVDMYTNPTNEKYPDEKVYNFIRAFEVENTDTRDLTYLLPSLEVQSEDKKLVELAKNITQGALNETEAIKKIHDFVVDYLSYDTPSYNDRSFINKPYDALTVFKTQIAVCSGYSNYLAALARAVGIRTRVVFGKALLPNGWEDHAWNEVFINGEWKIIDATWDDNNPTTYTYFFPNPKEFSKTHIKITDNPGT